MQYNVQVTRDVEQTIRADVLEMYLQFRMDDRRPGLTGWDKTPQSDVLMNYYMQIDYNSASFDINADAKSDSEALSNRSRYSLPS